RTPLSSGKAVQMKKMEDARRRKTHDCARAQQCLHESKSESLRPQPLGCGKTIIIRRETESVQVATLAGGFMEWTWQTPPQPRRNKTSRSCPCRKVFLRSAH